MGLIGLGSAVGHVVLPGHDRVLRHHVDDVGRQPLGLHDPGRLPADQERAAAAMIECCRSQSAAVVSASGLEIDRPALFTTRSTPP